MENERKILKEIKKNLNNVLSYENKDYEFIAVKIKANVSEINEINETINKVLDKLISKSVITKYDTYINFSYVNGFVYFMISDEHTTYFDFLDLELFFIINDDINIDIDLFDFK